MKHIKNYISIHLLLLISCAQVLPPTGGPTDQLAPKVLSIKPENKTTNFPLTNQKIVLKFDEYVQLKEASKQIVLSPPLKELPDYSINGKEIIISFKDSLKANTTYNINFGNAITDNHEGIVCNDLKYTFSTGSFIDSNFITGKVSNAFTGLLSNDVIVSLYKENKNMDSTIFLDYPTYFTKSKQDGTFTIENIPPGKYTLYGYKKEGTAIKYSKNDSIALFTDEVNVENRNKVYKLYLYKPNEHKINKIFDTVSTQKGVYDFVIYKPTNFVINPTDNKKLTIKKISGTNSIDTLRIFNEVALDSCKFKISTPDTTFSVNIKAKKKSVLPSLVLESKTNINPLDTLIIKCSTPIKKIMNDSILFKQDTIEQKPKYLKYNEGKMQFELYDDWKESTKYSLMIKDSALQDIYGNYNTQGVYNIDIKEFKEYGSLILNVELKQSEHPYIVQFINTKNSEILREFKVNNNTQLKLEYINPAELKVKIIADENANGVWDNGDLATKKLPEKVYNYSQIFNVRAYWDLEQNININDIINQQ